MLLLVIKGGLSGVLQSLQNCFTCCRWVGHETMRRNNTTEIKIVPNYHLKHSVLIICSSFSSAVG